MQCGRTAFTDARPQQKGDAKGPKSGGAKTPVSAPKPSASDLKKLRTLLLGEGAFIILAIVLAAVLNR